MHLKLNAPRRTSFPSQWGETTKSNTRTIRFSEPTRVSPPAQRERRLSCGNDRTLNPSVSGAEQSYDSSTRISGNNPSNMHDRTKDLYAGSMNEGTVITKTVTSKFSKNQKITETKASSASKRGPQLSKNHELVRSYKTYPHVCTSHFFYHDSSFQ